MSVFPLISLYHNSISWSNVCLHITQFFSLQLKFQCLLSFSSHLCIDWRHMLNNWHILYYTKLCVLIRTVLFLFCFVFVTLLLFFYQFILFSMKIILNTQAGFSYDATRIVATLFLFSNFLQPFSRYSPDFLEQFTHRALMITGTTWK